MRPPSPLPDSTALEASIKPDVHEAIDENLEADVRDILRDAFAGIPSGDLDLPTDDLTRPEHSVHSPIQATLATPTTYASAQSEVQSQDARPFFTPLSSVRGSLRLGGTAHHSHLSRGSLRASMICQELALPIATTGQLIVVPDAVSARSSIHAQARVGEHLQQQTIPQNRDRQQSQRQHRRRRRSISHRFVRRSVVAMSIYASLFMAVIAIYLTLALSGHNGVPVFLHVLFVLGLMVLLILFTHCAVRLFLAYGNHGSNKIHKTRHTGRRRHHRHMPSAPTEENLVPSSPIAVQFGDDSDAVLGLDLERGPEQATPRGPLHPPPAYGRWRGSVRLDPNLMHWRQVEGGTSVDGGVEGSPEEPPIYASPRTHRAEAIRRESEMVGNRGEMVEVEGSETV